MAWPADKRFMTPQQFRDHVAALDFSQWRPVGIVWHNTASPTLKRWHEFSRQHWMEGLEEFYKSKGWNGGPHLFIDDGVDGIGLFNPLNKRGTHSPSFNAQWIGIEHVGDYSTEDDDAGAGLLVKKNGIMATAILCLKLGLDPLTRIKLHKEDPQTDHDCPGKDMAQDKEKSIKAVLALMGDHGDHAPDWGDVATSVPKPKSRPGAFTVTATVFGGGADPNYSAYGDEHLITDNELGVALPFRFQGPRPLVEVWNGDKTIICRIVDVGPWNIDDPYWEAGTRPQAETGTDMRGRKTNHAGIDLTPAAAKAIGLDGLGVVDWAFIRET